MNSLIEQIQEQAGGAPAAAPQQGQQGEGEKKGKSFDEIMQAWQKAGQPKNTAQLYSLLKNLLGDEDAVIGAFDQIGIEFKKGGAKAQEVLKPETAKMIAAVAGKLKKNELEHMIKVVQAGKVLPLPGQPEQQAQGAQAPQQQAQQGAAA